MERGFIYMYFILNNLAFANQLRLHGGEGFLPPCHHDHSRAVYAIRIWGWPCKGKSAPGSGGAFIAATKANASDPRSFGHWQRLLQNHPDWIRIRRASGAMQRGCDHAAEEKPKAKAECAPNKIKGKRYRTEPPTSNLNRLRSLGATELSTYPRWDQRPQGPPARLPMGPPARYFRQDA